MLNDKSHYSSSYSSYSNFHPMSISGIQGQLLEVTVVGCNKLKNTEWISRQDPYVCVEYASTKYRTRTCTDGGKNPMFQEKFVFTLIEGLREFSVVVWNSNTLTFDDFIGNGKVQLQKVLSQGYDDSSWSLQDKRGRHAGEIRLIMHYSNTNKPGKTHGPSAPSAPSAPPPYAGIPSPQVPIYSAPPPGPSYPPTNYPPQQPHYPSYAPNASGYPPSPYQPNPAAAYPPYPPTSSYPSYPAYPPPPQDPHYYPPGSYPPPPYPPPPF